ncbi:hypothetical protein [Erythrobacter sp. 3-20A1M]|nr:hypothetical protein [Erythrobacter sp. 3-20A1M]
MGKARRLNAATARIEDERLPPAALNESSRGDSPAASPVSRDGNTPGD